jgi:hypothetical protein
MQIASRSSVLLGPVLNNLRRWGKRASPAVHPSRKGFGVRRQLFFLFVLPHCGMLPKVSLKNVTEPNRIWFHLIFKLWPQLS